MGFVLLEQDVAVLPTELLPAMKRHGRINDDDDDLTIKEKLGQAIDRIQTRGNFRIVPCKYTWTPSAADFCDGLALVPYPPVRTCTVSGVTDPAAYSVDLRAIDGVPITYLAGPFAAGMSVEIEAGFVAAADMPLSLTDAIERVAAHLYEHREILIPGSEFVAPDFATDLTWWLPRA